MDNKQIVFDLLEAFKEKGLTELEFSQGNLQFKIRREGQLLVQPSSDKIGITAAAATDQTVSSQNQVGTKSVIVNSEYEFINAPMVGTFYRSPAPDAPPFVEEGQIVDVEKPLCIVEAMKQMNHFEAEFKCRIIRVLVENATAVEFGQPLFEVEKL